MKNTRNITIAELNNVSGGMVLDDRSPEEILEETRRVALWWVEQGRRLEDALDLLSRLMYTPGVVERDVIDQVIREVYGAA